MADILVNKSNRAVVVDGTLFVPGKHIPNQDVAALTAKYPRVKAMIESGEMAVVTPEEAARTRLEEKPMDELQAIAKKEDIDVSELTEKEEVVAVLKAEKSAKKKK